MKATSKISSSGLNQAGLKTTIPKAIAEKTGWKVGDLLVWETQNSEVNISRL